LEDDAILAADGIALGGKLEARMEAFRR